MESQFRATPNCPWPLLSKREVEELSPSRKEGMAYEKEMSFLRSMCELMRKIGKLMISLFMHSEQYKMHTWRRRHPLGDVNGSGLKTYLDGSSLLRRQSQAHSSSSNCHCLCTPLLCAQIDAEQ